MQRSPRVVDGSLVTATALALRQFFPSTCNCRCCTYDHAAWEHRRRGRLGPPAELTPYDPLELLDCPSFANFGPVQATCRRERKFWKAHNPAALAWLRERIAAGLTEVEQARFAASSLLEVPIVRAWGSTPGIPDRPPYVWDEVDAYEIVFDVFGMGGGVMAGWSTKLVLDELRSFARYLVTHGLIPPEHGAGLDADLDVWIPRLLECFDGHRWWYLRDGRRIRNGITRV